MGVGLVGVSARRDSANATVGSWRASSWTRSASSPTSATFTTSASPYSLSRTPYSCSAPNRIGSPCLSCDEHLGPLVAARDVLERAVVEDVAVLVDLDERRTAVLVGAPEHLLHVLAVHVVGAGDEARLRADRDRDRVERVVERAERRALGDLADLARRRVLALGETVDLVVEEQDRHVHVAAQRVDQVVATDRQTVAVTGDDPDVEVGPGRARHPVATAGARPWMLWMP